jgi:hypothetical protein
MRKAEINSIHRIAQFDELLLEKPRLFVYLDITTLTPGFESAHIVVSLIGMVHVSSVEGCTQCCKGYE